MTTPKLCECGCGQVAPQRTRDRGRIGRKGDYLRFINGGHARRVRMSGRSKTSGGYIVVRDQVVGFREFEHRLIAERALGHALPQTAPVHHVNGDTSDNSPSNLVVCQDQSYHALLHQRTRALEICGNADWRLCQYCRTYDDPTAMYVTRINANHRECAAQYQRARRAPTLKGRERTHCRRGHALVAENLYVYPYGRVCRACHRERAIERRHVSA